MYLCMYIYLYIYVYFFMFMFSCLVTDQLIVCDLLLFSVKQGKEIFFPIFPYFFHGEPEGHEILAFCSRSYKKTVVRQKKNCFFLAIWTIFQCVKFFYSDVMLQHPHVCLKLALFFCCQVSIINSSDLTFIQNFTGEQVTSSNYVMKYCISRPSSFLHIVSRIYKMFFVIMTIKTKRIVSKQTFHFISNMKVYLLFFVFRWHPILGTQLQYLMLTTMGKLPNIFSSTEH